MPNETPAPPAGSIAIVPNREQRRRLDKAALKSTGAAFDPGSKNCGRSVNDWNNLVAERDGWQKQALKSHEMAGTIERMRLAADQEHAAAVSGATAEARLAKIAAAGLLFIDAGLALALAALLGGR